MSPQSKVLWPQKPEAAISCCGTAHPNWPEHRPFKAAWNQTLCPVRGGSQSQKSSQGARKPFLTALPVAQQRLRTQPVSSNWGTTKPKDERPHPFLSLHSSKYLRRYDQHCCYHVTTLRKEVISKRKSYQSNYLLTVWDCVCHIDFPCTESLCK